MPGSQIFPLLLFPRPNSSLFPMALVSCLVDVADSLANDCVANILCSLGNTSFNSEGLAGPSHSQFPYTIQVQTLLPPRKRPIEAEANSRHVPHVGTCGVQWLRQPALELETEVHSSSTTYLTILSLSFPTYMPVVMLLTYLIMMVKRTMCSMKFHCMGPNPRSTS